MPLATPPRGARVGIALPRTPLRPALFAPFILPIARGEMRPARAKRATANASAGGGAWSRAGGFLRLRFFAMGESPQAVDKRPTESHRRSKEHSHDRQGF